MTVSMQSLDRQPITMVLVTDQFQCERLIVAGAELAKKNDTQLRVMNVASPNTPQNPEAIEYLFQTSKENEATMLVHYSDEPAKYITTILNDSAPVAVVSGMPVSENSLLHRIWFRFTDIDFYTVDESGVLSAVSPSDKIIA